MTTVTEEFVGPAGGDWVQIADVSDRSVLIEDGQVYRLDHDKPDFVVDATGFIANGNTLIRGKDTRVWVRLAEGAATVAARSPRELFLSSDA